MGKGRKWLRAVKKIFGHESKDKNADEHKSPKSKKKWPFAKSKPVDSYTSPSVLPRVTEVKLTESKHEQNSDVYAAAVATAQAAAAAAQAAAEVVRLASNAKNLSSKPREEVAAIRIQTAFRGCLARRALRALRGLDRLKSLMHCDGVRQQTKTTLRYVQTVSRIQSEIRSRRTRITEENQALQRHLQLKCERDLEAPRTVIGEEWDGGPQSKQKIESSTTSKNEAATRRERALAYAFSHQWRSCLRSKNAMVVDLNNPQWGWNWLERWVAARPHDSQSITGKEPGNDQGSIRSTSQSIGGEITKACACRDGEGRSPVAKKPNGPASHQSPSTPPSKKHSVAGKRIKSASPKGRRCPSEEDSRSLCSVRSERIRRHCITRSSIRDDESLASSPAVPNYMTPTESARLKSRSRSPSSRKGSTPERSSISSVKKRLSFPAADKQNMLSPAGPRRHSVPLKVDASSTKNILI